MRHRILATVYLSAVVFYTAGVSASEASPKPSKARLVPRALPNDSPPMSGAEEHLVRRPSNGGASCSGVVLVQPEEKARIGAIRRGGGDASKLSAEKDALTGGKDGVSRKSALPPLRLGQIRVLPKSETKTDAGFQITAQTTP